MCGAPRLGGVSQSVLTIEWTPPVDDGGSQIVGYWLWVRPYSAMCAVNSDSWFEHGHVKHVEGELAQRADVHTDELNPTVGRYLCSVAALNAAEQVGPPTPEVNSLPFPNPCAICGPSLQAQPFSEPLGAYQTLQHDYLNQDVEFDQPNDMLGQRPSGNGRGLGQVPQQILEQFNSARPDRQPPPPPQLVDDPGIGPYGGSPYTYGALDSEAAHMQRSDFAHAVAMQEAAEQDAPVPRGAPAHARGMREMPDDDDAALQRFSPAHAEAMWQATGGSQRVNDIEFRDGRGEHPMGGSPEMPGNFSRLQSAEILETAFAGASSDPYPGDPGGDPYYPGDPGDAGWGYQPSEAQSPSSWTNSVAGLPQATGQTQAAFQEVGKKQESGWAAMRQPMSSGPAAGLGAEPMGGLQAEGKTPGHHNLSSPSRLVQPRAAAAAAALAAGARQRNGVCAAGVNDQIS